MQASDCTRFVIVARVARLLGACLRWASLLACCHVRVLVLAYSSMFVSRPVGGRCRQPPASAVQLPLITVAMATSVGRRMPHEAAGA